MSIEFWAVLAVLLAGITSYLIGWKCSEDRRKKVAEYGLVQPNSAKESIISLIFYLAIMLFGVWVYSFAASEISGNKLYLVYFEGFMFVIFLALRFTEKFEKLGDIEDNLTVYAVTVPMIAIVIGVLFLLFGFESVEAEYLTRTVISMMGVVIVASALLLIAGEIIPQLKNGEEIQEKIERFLWRQERKISYLLVLSIILAFALTI